MSTIRSTLRISCAFAVAVAAPAAGVASSLGACGAPATRVHTIQGAARSSPLLGEEHVVEAVVVGVFPGLGGFFLQEEDADTDGDPLTSEGLFVFERALGEALRVGDGARVRGRVGEFFGLTELSRVTGVRSCPPRGEARTVSVRLPVTGLEAWERWEGMRVRVGPALVVTELRNLARFGEVELAAAERLWQPTHRTAPGAPALALQVRNQKHRILLDDGDDAPRPAPTPYLDRADGGTLRVGDPAGEVEGVLDFAFGRFRIHPTAPVRFREGEPRPETPPHVDGTVRVVAWNVANHMNGDGRGGGFPTRGPRSPAELERQREKLVATLVRLDPDVAALVELENDGFGPESTVRQLADALNRKTFGASYAVVEPGEPRLGEHPIAVGILYRPSVATPIGSPALLTRMSHPTFDDARNRPSLAQTFEARATKEPFTVVVNHWKSKGSDCDAAGDPDVGDGQGECSGTRRQAARALLEWLARDPTGAGDVPVLVTGDLNAYPREDAVRLLEAARYVDLLAPDDYTFGFDGQAGRLDYLLGRADLLPLVGGAGVWHTNVDEPRVFDHRAESSRYSPDPFRASDHDPVLLGLFPDADADGVTDARDACPSSTGEATVRLGDCDSGVPDRVDPSGCTLIDGLTALLERGTKRRHRLREIRSWLTERVDEGSIARADRGAILACAARWR
jgi:predicted extracellular nuclease